MSPSVLFYTAIAVAVSVGALRLLLDVLRRRRLESATAPLHVDDEAWLDAFARGIGNDHEILQGYLRKILDLLHRDRAEAQRRLDFAQEQTERGALPDALDTLEILRRLLPSVPAVPHLSPWPRAPLRRPSARLLVALASVGRALALTGQGRASVRLWLIERVVRRSVRAFSEAASAPLDDGFERVRLGRLQAAAGDLESAQVALVTLAQELLQARATWERLESERE